MRKTALKQSTYSHEKAVFSSSKLHFLKLFFSPVHSLKCSIGTETAPKGMFFQMRGISFNNGINEHFESLMAYKAPSLTLMSFISSTTIYVDLIMSTSHKDGDP